MKKSALAVMSVLFFFYCSAGFCQNKPNPQDERASFFAAGEADVSETFGQAEGTVLFGLGIAAIVAVFGLSFWCGSVQHGNRERLGRIEQKESLNGGGRG